MKSNKEDTVISRLRQRIKPENKLFVRKNLQISSRIDRLLLEKGWSTGEFALRMGEEEYTVADWLTGLHNLSLKEITKMEALLGGDIIKIHENS